MKIERYFDRGRRAVRVNMGEIQILRHASDPPREWWVYAHGPRTVIGMNVSRDVVSVLVKLSERGAAAYVCGLAARRIGGRYV